MWIHMQCPWFRAHRCYSIPSDDLFELSTPPCLVRRATRYAGTQPNFPPQGAVWELYVDTRIMAVVANRHATESGV